MESFNSIRVQLARAITNSGVFNHYNVVVSDCELEHLIDHIVRDGHDACEAVLEFPFYSIQYHVMHSFSMPDSDTAYDSDTDEMFSDWDSEESE